MRTYGGFHTGTKISAIGNRFSSRTIAPFPENALHSGLGGVARSRCPNIGEELPGFRNSRLEATAQVIAEIAFWQAGTVFAPKLKQKRFE